MHNAPNAVAGDSVHDATRKCQKLEDCGNRQRERFISVNTQGSRFKILQSHSTMNDSLALSFYLTLQVYFRFSERFKEIVHPKIEPDTSPDTSPQRSGKSRDHL